MSEPATTPEDETTFLTKVGTGAPVLFSTATLACAIGLGSSGSERLWTALFWLAGTGVGWILGTLVSPVETKEEKRFNQAGGVISGLLSGFVASKLDRVFEKALETGALLETPFLLNALAFAIAAVFAALLVFVVRSY